MADIELVINITKHEWEYLNKLVENGDQLGHYERLLVNGTPLPKGHGRLIDEDDIKEIELEDSLHFIHHEKGDEVEVYIDAPTILEADKEEKY